jgi:beta-lactamase superfamily II metal-dependent hydrolase
MATIHFLNVREGDCIVVQHNSDRVSMIDISCGNITEIEEPTNRFIKSSGLAGAKTGSNFNMKAYPTKPQNYLAALGIKSIWRFILTHPDMDHLDGFNALLDEITVNNFWHSGADKPKPDFTGYSRYKEEDWARYAKVRDDKDAAITTLKVIAGKVFKYANEDDNGGGGDGLRVIAPTQSLVDDANASKDFNDCSYMILYRTGGFKIIFSGDSHDATWEHILENHAADVADCDILIAPHHGRDSGRSWDFLDVLKPRLTLFGVANSEHLAYDAWNRRNLDKITNNQAGNVVLDIDSCQASCRLNG